MVTVPEPIEYPHVPRIYDSIKEPPKLNINDKTPPKALETDPFPYHKVNDHDGPAKFHCSMMKFLNMREVSRRRESLKLPCNATRITLRNIVDGIPVEKQYPLYSPLITDFKTIKYERGNKSRLFYLRNLKCHPVAENYINPNLYRHLLDDQSQDIAHTPSSTKK